MVAQQVGDYFLRIQAEDFLDQFHLRIVVVQRTLQRVVDENTAFFTAAVDVLETAKSNRSY